jgi:hypothetical protein
MRRLGRVPKRARNYLVDKATSLEKVIPLGQTSWSVFFGKAGWIFTMNSMFGNIEDEHVRFEPFPHILHTQALEPEYYRKLADEFPDPQPIFPDGWEKNNEAFALSGITAIEHGLATPIWREFFKYHFSKDFFLEIVKVFGDQIRRIHPDLEAQLGKSLESLTVAPRRLGIEADVFLDCQFCINSPVRDTV